MYKLFAQVVGDADEGLKPVLDELGIKCTKTEMRMNIRSLLKLVCTRFLGDFNCFVDMCVECIPSPLESARKKVEATWRGQLDSRMGKSMVECNPNGPLVVHTTKQYSNQDASTFNVFGLVLSGTLQAGQMVKVSRNEMEDKVRDYKFFRSLVDSRRELFDSR